MPFLSIHTNTELDETATQEFLKKASLTIAEILGKPENYVMVAIQPAQAMMFAGSSDPLAYLALKSIGLPQAKTAEFSQSLCALVSDSLVIPQNRIYIEFHDAERSLWGWDGRTF